jgi:hypothetical protein
MGRHKSKKRAYKLIGFKAYMDADADLLAWWESVPTGDRSEALRDLIRTELGYQVNKPTRANELALLREDSAWIRNAILELPHYVEQVIHYVTANTASLPEARAPTDVATLSTNGYGLNDQAAKRREQRMKKTQW